MAATLIKPLPPAAVTASMRAWATGSSGRGKGIRSIMTSLQVCPGTSTPCHRLRLPTRQESSSRVKASTRVGSWSSPWA